MNIFHDSYSNEYREPFGAALTGSEVKLCLKADDALSVSLHTYSEAEGDRMLPGEYMDGLYRWSVRMPQTDGLVWYFFVIDYPDQTVCYGNNDQFRGGVGRIYYPGETPVSYKISVYHGFKAPDWYKEGIVYQIFPDRFCRAEGTPEIHGRRYEEWDTLPYYIKDTDGSVQVWNFWGGNLRGITDKLEYIKSLGVNTIYLNPIFRARSNHRYDTADYFEIDPVLGALRDFKDLCSAAKELDMHVILDGVFSHTGVDSKYFRDKPDWYQHNGDEVTYWWGVKDLPQLDEMNPEYSDMICGKDGVLRYWLEAGAEGWRLDVADELPDAFMRRIRRTVKDVNRDNLLIGEVWEDASDKVDYGVRMHFLGGQELDGVMNYPLREDIIAFVRKDIDAAEFASRQMSRMENYPKEAFMACFNCLGSHDRERILTALGSKEAVKFATALQYVMPGVPVIYYGDETSLEGGTDPDNRRTYPWGSEDEDMIEHFRSLGRIRRNSLCLKRGSFKIYAEDGNLVIERAYGSEQMRFVFDAERLTKRGTRIKQ
ncbi:MAG: glycoside hydrolase family 13 protein [Lachnospiraceae bacterium]|nr:glycoside hydrolase family 13 protein [Lachnospiraceae bacterium]